jgi:hypothetical protein
MLQQNHQVVLVTVLVMDIKQQHHQVVVVTALKKQQVVHVILKVVTFVYQTVEKKHLV